MTLYIITIEETYKYEVMTHEPIVCLTKKEATSELIRLKKNNWPDYLKSFGCDAKKEYHKGESFMMWKDGEMSETHYFVTVHKIVKELKPRDRRFLSFDIMRKEDRREITDSLLLDSGTNVAEGKTKDGYEFVIQTQGHVRVLWKGEIFKHATDFPDDLTEALKNHTFYDLGYPDTEVQENNWYELLIYDPNGKLLFSDLVDIDLSTIKVHEIKDLVLETIKEITKN